MIIFITEAGFAICKNLKRECVEATETKLNYFISTWSETSWSCSDAYANLLATHLLQPKIGETVCYQPCNITRFGNFFIDCDVWWDWSDSIYHACAKVHMKMKSHIVYVEDVSYNKSRHLMSRAIFCLCSIFFFVLSVRISVCVCARASCIGVIFILCIHVHVHCTCTYSISFKLNTESPIESSERVCVCM